METGTMTVNLKVPIYVATESGAKIPITDIPTIHLGDRGKEYISPKEPLELSFHIDNKSIRKLVNQLFQTSHLLKSHGKQRNRVRANNRRNRFRSK